MVNESCRTEPELSAAFTCGIHHAEVVDSCPQHSAVSGAQLCDATQQDLHPLSCEPTEQQFKHHISTVKRKKKPQDMQQLCSFSIDSFGRIESKKGQSAL